VALDTFQVEGLKRLANVNGTTVGAELSNAVEAYLLLVLFADMTKASASKINQNLSETLRETDKSFARIARMERRRIKSRRKKQR
jgi:hypothetical protein